MEWFPLYGLVLMVLVAKSQDTGESIGPFSLHHRLLR